MHSKTLSSGATNHLSRTLFVACLLYGVTGCDDDVEVDLNLTGPYMHNGTFSSIRQAIEFYDDPESENPNVH